MKKIINSSIINWELFQKLIKGKSKILKEPFTYDSFMKQMKEEYNYKL
jgi:hypothetical protein